MTIPSMLLEADDLHIAYGRVEAVRGVSLRIGDGQIVSIIGPNGKKKSTLLNGLMGLIRTSGRLSFFGTRDAIPGVKTWWRAASRSFRNGAICSARSRSRTICCSCLCALSARRARSPRHAGRGVRAFSAAARAPQSGRRYAVGRRAPDARDRPRHDVEAEIAAAGRAEPRPGAADRARHFPRYRRFANARRCLPARGAGLGRRLAGRGLCLCAWNPAASCCRESARELAERSQ